MRDVEQVPVTVDEWGYERHPSYGMIAAHRVQSTGTVLFDSDLQHQQFVMVRISRAGRKRDLHHDWPHPSSKLDDTVEIEMSEAQWASFVSSMNTQGVPCTLSLWAGERIPDPPYEPRLALSVSETTAAADEAFRAIREAFAVYDANRTAANRRVLRAAIENAVSNVTFASKTLVGHAENTVDRARADVEAMVVRHATQLGIDPAVVTLPELEAGAS